VLGLDWRTRWAEETGKERMREEASGKMMETMLEKVAGKMTEKALRVELGNSSILLKPKPLLSKQL